MTETSPLDPLIRDYTDRYLLEDDTLEIYSPTQARFRRIIPEAEGGHSEVSVFLEVDPEGHLIQTFEGPYKDEC